jgi:hypothetical protein
MKSALALFSQPGVFVSFVGTKEKGINNWQMILNKFKSSCRRRASDTRVKS